MFPLFETIKILDGKIYNLSFHQKRLEFSFETYFYKKATFLLSDIISIPNEFSKGLVKLRFLYSEKNYKVEFFHYRPRKISTLKVVENNEINYSLKFTNRSQINDLLRQQGFCDDILIIKNGFITDTSIANIVFYNGKEWITPTTPLLMGTCRAKLLKENKIKEEVIKITDLHKFKAFCLINALNCSNLSPIPITNVYF
ncbi:aminotransferase class IV family protein [Desulfurella sp.]|uniref:aminotransferase class IV family protein n=1 Tax=Desulfurella sp. TaxID=1962857 RepID=UPI0025BAD556|nr:aminotransferase class IV family protein [Desulfurella sp.]